MLITLENNNPSDDSLITDGNGISDRNDLSNDDENYFDAIDYFEMDDTWFDTKEDISDENEEFFDAVEELIPFTEDCKRCVKQFILHLGEVKKNELIFSELSKILPSLPSEFFLTAHSLYTAITERKNIDIAVLNTLRFTSAHLLIDGNAISLTANFIKETISSYIGNSFLNQYFYQNENDSYSFNHIFTALSVVSITAKYWMVGEVSPQRRWLRVPAFLGNLLIRTSCYWDSICYMAQYKNETCNLTVNADNYNCVKLESNTINKIEDSQYPWLCTKRSASLQPLLKKENICFFQPPSGPLIGMQEKKYQQTIKKQKNTYSSASNSMNDATFPLVATSTTAVVTVSYPAIKPIFIAAATIMTATGIIQLGRFLSKKQYDAFFEKKYR